MNFHLTTYRFSNDVAAMSAFLQSVGLTLRTSTEGLGFAVLAGRAGTVAVHSATSSDTGAAPSETQLSFEVHDADAAAAHLRSAGLDVREWDESFGQALGVQTPRGGIWINAESTDSYGYVIHEPTEPAPVDVVAVHFSEDFARDTALFGHFGFTPSGPGSEGWSPLASPGHGVIGLHAPMGSLPEGNPDSDAPIGAPLVVHLSLATSEDLEELAGRLRSLGYHDARVVSEENATKVHVRDPDGIEVEIHRAS